MDIFFTLLGSGEDYGDCKYGIVAVTPQLVKTVAARTKVFEAAKKKDARFVELCYFADDVECYDSDAVEYVQGKIADQSAYCKPVATCRKERLAFDKALKNGHMAFVDCIVPFNDSLYQPIADVEYQEMYVNENGVYWSMRPKHCETPVETCVVSLKMLQGLLEKGKANGKDQQSRRNPKR